MNLFVIHVCSVIVLSHWPHVAEQVATHVASVKDSDTSCRTCCSTCVQCEWFQQHSRTQVEQQVAQLVTSVNGSLEIHGEYKFSNKLVAELVEQHVASVKAL